MDTLEAIVASNLAEFRRNAGLTQAELAEKINYSDKSISKWERGEALPDLKVLAQLAELYGVTMNDFVTKDAGKQKAEPEVPKSETRYRIGVELFAACSVWLAATAIFFSTAIYSTGYWMAFAWAVPLSMLVLALFSQRWGFGVCVIVFRSIFCWTFLTAVFFQLLYYSYHVWMVFLIGIPLQAAIILWSLIRHNR